MSNLALTTLAFIILASPGYLLRSRYYSHEFTRHLLPKNWSEDVVKAILFALPFHVIGIWILELWKHAGLLHTDLDFQVLFAVLSGDYGKDPRRDIQKIYANAGLISGYMGVLWIYAFILGEGGRRIVWDRRLDVKHRYLRFRNEWLYRLKAREVPLPYEGAEILVLVEALTRIAVEEAREKTRLYRGLLLTFSMDETGKPEEILLKDAQRGEFRVQGQELKLEWKQISPSRLFIIKYSDLLNLNITYALPAQALRRGPAEPGHPAGIAQTRRTPRVRPRK